jgi:hypothetical protein
MPTVNEGNYVGDIVKYEADSRYSRDSVVIGAAANLVKGAVLGQAVTGAFVVANAVAGTNTGNGTVTQSGTATARYGDDVIPGTYTARCITAAANGGTFVVTAPNGAVIGNAVVGTAFNSPHIVFTINDGAADYVVGDTFTFVVDQIAEGKWYAYSPTATDGRQVAAGILLQDASAASADVTAVILTRQARIDSSYLTWFAGATANQIATGLAMLEARGIVSSKGV